MIKICTLTCFGRCKDILSFNLMVTHHIFIEFKVFLKVVETFFFKPHETNIN